MGALWSIHLFNVNIKKCQNCVENGLLVQNKTCAPSHEVKIEQIVQYRMEGGQKPEKKCSAYVFSLLQMTLFFQCFDAVSLATEEHLTCKSLLQQPKRFSLGMWLDL